ncbi:hypothetical protein BDQ17DRAFT_452285 [Cyathus striatus]|nr:hypothetical protein BDQ17DRAFT_452285 [Cyathus striatus]
MIGASIAAVFASILWIWERTKYAEEEKNFLRNSTSGTQSLFLKFLYICARYTMALALIFHIWYFAVLSAYSPNIPHRYCQGMLLYESLTTYYFMGILNLIMTVRIYALYNKRLAMAIFLVILFTGWMFCSVFSLLVYLPKHKFSERCELTNMVTEAVYFTAFIHLGTQMIFVLLTFGRTISIKSALLGDIAILKAIGPLLQRLTQDTWMILAFAAASAILTILWPSDTKFMYKYNITEIIFPFYSLLISAGGCRLILHTRRIATPQPNVVASPLDSIWTTNIEMEDLRVDGA